MSDKPWHSQRNTSVKNTSRSKEEIDNALTDKTEQVTLRMKQSFSFQIFFFFF